MILRRFKRLFAVGMILIPKQTENGGKRKEIANLGDLRVWLKK